MTRSLRWFPSGMAYSHYAACQRAAISKPWRKPWTRQEAAAKLGDRGRGPASRTPVRDARKRELGKRDAVGRTAKTVLLSSRSRSVSTSDLDTILFFFLLYYRDKYTKPLVSRVQLRLKTSLSRTDGKLKRTTCELNCSTAGGSLIDVDRGFLAIAPRHASGPARLSPFANDEGVSDRLTPAFPPQRQSVHFRQRHDVYSLVLYGEHDCGPQRRCPPSPLASRSLSRDSIPNRLPGSGPEWHGHDLAGLLSHRGAGSRCSPCPFSRDIKVRACGRRPP